MNWQLTIDNRGLVSLNLQVLSNLRKQPTFGDATTGFPPKWRLRKERRNSTLMTRHYTDLGSASDWLNQIFHVARPITSTIQIWVVTRHQGLFLSCHLAEKPVVASAVFSG